MDGGHRRGELWEADQNQTLYCELVSGAKNWFMQWNKVKTACPSPVSDYRKICKSCYTMQLFQHG